MIFLLIANNSILLSFLGLIQALLLQVLLYLSDNAVLILDGLWFSMTLRVRIRLRFWKNYLADKVSVFYIQKQCARLHSRV